jgi:hypothetical protein
VTRVGSSLGALERYAAPQPLRHPLMYPTAAPLRVRRSAAFMGGRARTYIPNWYSN